MMVNLNEVKREKKRLGSPKILDAHKELLLGWYKLSPGSKYKQILMKNILIKKEFENDALHEELKNVQIS